MELPGAPAGLAHAVRREGFLVGAVVGAALAAATVGPGSAPLAVPTGRRRAPIALADGLLIELTSGGVDLRRLAGRWVEWRRDDGLDAGPLLAAALDHLRDFDAPVSELPAGSVVALAAALPAALASASPRAMISGSFHVARMLDPAEATGLATIATVLTAAALLEGRRDFVPDVVAALRANDASPLLLDAIRTVPRDPSSPPPIPRGADPDPVAAVTWLLWQVHHAPRGQDLLHEIGFATDIAPTIGALTGALFGAREGTGSWPDGWLAAAGEEVALRQALAARL